MDELEPKNEKTEEEHRFDPELLKKGLHCDLDQYERLKRCSDKKDMTEWNQWRNKHPTVQIILKGARFERAHLEGVVLDGANLQFAVLWEVNLKCANLVKANLQGANPVKAHLEGAILVGAHLEGTQLHETHMEGTQLLGAHLEGTILNEAYLQGAYLREAPLQGAYLVGTHLEGANLKEAILEGADLQGAYLEGACIDGAHLEGANLHLAHVDSSTSIWACKISRKTNFEGVALDRVRIDPGTKQLLEYNIRRKNWEEWYPKQHWLLQWLVCKFWQISDYGLSTKRIIRTFFVWALVFAIVYYIWGCIDYYFMGVKDNPGIVSDLFVLKDNQEVVSPCLVPFRAIYFSIVTMTTLGFGDMYANAHSFLRGLFGHVLLALQVILGYVLLGALVTRFAVMFMAGGPAGEFADEK
ncbi:MAG: pentapeptide repeat-containing protein [Sedimentisphaerales bacterium]|nr:pentapeptide repeat-containing protein [Sedimentisphaerales bacterium]